MGINENRILCQLQANRTTNCNEMDTVRRGLKDVHELQDYVDAQAGGPGGGRQAKAASASRGGAWAGLSS